MPLTGLFFAVRSPQPSTDGPDPLHWTGWHTLGLVVVGLVLGGILFLSSRTSVPQPQVTPLPTATPPPDGVLLLETFADDTARHRWLPASGEWVFTPGALVQQDRETYSALAGYVHPLDWVALRVVFQHEQGSGGGLMFNAVHPDSRDDAHVIRFHGPQLIWGYYNMVGEFIRQGSAAVPDPGVGPHTLEVIVRRGRYTVRLDGEALARNAALINTEGYIGLLSVQSVVRYTAVEAYTSHTYLSSD